MKHIGELFVFSNAFVNIAKEGNKHDHAITQIFVILALVSTINQNLASKKLR